MSKSSNVHRHSEFDRLKQAILNFSESVTIIGINGYGGVGKTYLLDSVLGEIDTESEKVLLLRTDGSNSATRDDFAAIFEYQNSMAPRHLPPPANTAYDYFSHTHEAVKCYRDITSQLVNDISKQAVSKGFDAEFMKSLVDQTIKLGTAVNQILPITKEKIVDVSHVANKQQHINHIIEVVETTSKVLRKASVRGPFKHLRRQTLKDKIISNFHNAVAESIVTDLSAAISGYQRKDILKPTKQRIPNIEKLIIVIDDFEITKDILADFLIEDLLPELQTVKFPTLFIILGRDDLQASYPNFSRLNKFIEDEIHLEPFSKEDAMEFLKEQQILGKEATQLYKDSHGYPFLLKLLVEGRNSNQNSALFIQKFYERTTRWMTPCQKEWLLNLCYLDIINQATIQSMLPDDDAENIMNWFRNEASVRDPNSSDYTINPLIKDKMLSYHRNILGKKEAARLKSLGSEISNE